MSTDTSHYHGLQYWGPMAPARIETMLDLLTFAHGTSCRALDVGCGRGELLLRLVERFNLAALGVDHSPGAVELAMAEAARRVPSGDVDFQVTDATEFRSQEAFDFVSWLGGPYLGDSYASTLDALRSCARPGAYLLTGHGFWESDPPAEYAEATGIPREEFGTHSQNIDLGRSMGLTLLYTGVSNRDEWDKFEGRILHNWEERLVSDPKNEELRSTVERKRVFNDAQQRWGRSVMGFGFYLFRKQ